MFVVIHHQVKKSIGVALRQQLYDSLKAAILCGELQEGERLPSIRKACALLNVSRTTLQGAYEQLAFEGYLQSREKSAYWVLARIPESPEVDQVDRVQDADRAGAEPKRSGADPIAAVDCRYYFGSQRVEEGLFDMTAWKRLIRRALSEGGGLYAYGEKAGERPLREAIARYLGRVRGMDCAVEQVFIAAGVQSLLYMLCGVLPKQGQIAYWRPEFIQAAQVFQDCGMKSPALSPGLGDLRRQSAIQGLYLLPQSQGVGAGTLNYNDRQELRHWLDEDEGRFVIEDDYNGELRYRATPVQAFFADAPRQTYYLGSFSKTLLPSVRISYLVAPACCLDALRNHLLAFNCTASVLEQNALAGFIRSGALEKQLRKIRKVYGGKCQAVLSQLRGFGPRLENLNLRETELRFYFDWRTRLAAGVAARRLREAGIELPLSPGTKPGRLSCRLNFDAVPPAAIGDSMGALKVALTKLDE